MPLPTLPLLPGPWLPLDDDESAEFITRLDRHLATAGTAPPFTRGGSLHDLRAVPLSFYPGWLVVEGEAAMPDGLVGTFDVLYGPGLLWCLDGTVDLIHALNGGQLWSQASDVEAAKGEPPAAPFPSPLAPLEAAHTGPDYLRFFCNAIRGDHGCFRLVESAADVAACGGSADDAPWRDELAPLTMTFAESAEPGGRSMLRGRALMLYGSDLSRVEFELSPNGLVRMLDDMLVAEDVAPPERTQGHLRHLRSLAGR